MDGTWLTLSKPTYSEEHGKNQYDESMYSLGRMSFLICSDRHICNAPIQGIFNTIQMLDPAKGELPYSMPKKIRKELERV
jgi:hypothetical protein